MSKGAAYLSWEGGACVKEAKKTWLGLFFLVVLLYNAGSAWADQAESTARAAYVMDMKTGRVLFAYNEQESLPMASTTKVMTALLALEKGNLEDRVVTGRAAYGVPGTSIYLDFGESLALEEMLYGLMLASGNDAAVAIAEHIGGSVEGFCQMMNERAVELGATGTHFANPNGLPAKGHVTTARDLSIIAAKAMESPVFREIVSTERASIPWEGREYMRVLKNKNQLLGDYEGATGIKTGFTKAAGRCLVFGSSRGDMEIIGVVLNCGDWFAEAARLMDLCYGRYEWIEMLPDGELVGYVTVEGGEGESAMVVMRGALAAPVAKMEMPLMTIEMVDSVIAPQPSGAQVGWATMRVGEEILDRRPLVLADPVMQEPTALQRWIVCWPLL